MTINFAQSLRMITLPRDGDPQRSRAVFAQQDFGLIRSAIWHYLQTMPEDADRHKYSNLYHRLGRVA